MASGFFSAGNSKLRDIAVGTPCCICQWGRGGGGKEEL
jgi:hypothetical protein